MYRWRLWSAVVSGTLAVVAPGGYVGWRHFNVAADTKAEEPPPSNGADWSVAQAVRIPDQGGSPPFNPMAPTGLTLDNSAALNRTPGQDPQAAQPPPNGPIGSYGSGNNPFPPRTTSGPAFDPIQPAAPNSTPNQVETPAQFTTPPFPPAVAGAVASSAIQSMATQMAIQSVPQPSLARSRYQISDDNAQPNSVPPAADVQTEEPPARPAVRNFDEPPPQSLNSYDASSLRDVGRGELSRETAREAAPGESTGALSRTGADSDAVPSAISSVPEPPLPSDGNRFRFKNSPAPESLVGDVTREPATAPPPKPAPSAKRGATSEPPAARRKSPGFDRSNLSSIETPPPAAMLAIPPAVLPSRHVALTSQAPGERKLEGAQTPTLNLQKIAPDEIQVGKLARFSVKVRNAGQVAAHGVVVTDQVPLGTQFVESAPATTPSANGVLTWELGTMQPGDESTIVIDLMPTGEGEIGSVAQLTFHAQAAMRTIATRPMLVVEHSGPKSVLIGEDALIHIVVSNPGTGVATGVIVEIDVPEQMAHEGGREIMSDRFDLRPNETRKLDLVMKAVRPGRVNNIVRAAADASLSAEHRTQFDVVAPGLKIAVNGPTRRFLQRQATYEIAVQNPGTAPAQNIELVAYLPQGLKFVGAEKKGQYDQRKHAVQWSLDELPPGETGTVQITAIPVDPGQQKLHIEGRAALDLSATFDHTTVVEALTELVFTVTDVNDPIEVGSETTYEIRVMNNGSKVATNVQLIAQLPAELNALEGDGPTKPRVEKGNVVMGPVPQIRPREEIIYHIKVQGTRAGDHVVRVQIVCDDLSNPITKEESTKVYADQ